MRYCQVSREWDEEGSAEGSKRMIMQKQENILTKQLTSNKQQCQHSSFGLVHSLGSDNHSSLLDKIKE